MTRSTKSNGRRRFIVGMLMGCALCLLGGRVIAGNIISGYAVPSASMEPTLMGHDIGLSPLGTRYPGEIDDYVLIDRLAYRIGAPKFGDIVVFRAPIEADAEHVAGAQVENELVKRLIGLPGDTIEIKNGRVYRNGTPLNEPYIKEPMDAGLESRFLFGAPNSPGDARTPGGAIHLGANQYWVMGDNRNNSNDSRYWGPLTRERILGKVTSVIAPLSRIHKIK